MRKTAFALASLLALALLPGSPPGGLGSAARAASGDTLVVTGDGVNVRYGPSTSARVKMRVYHDQQVMELQREGDWVRGEIAGSGGQDGWIHGSLLAAPGGEQLAPPSSAAAAPPPKPALSAAQMPPPADLAPAPGEVVAVASDGARPPTTVAARSPAASATSRAPETAAVEPAAAPAATDEHAELARFRQSVEYLNSRALAVAGVDLFGDVKEAGGGVVQVAATEAWSTIPPAGQQSYANTLLDRWAAARGAGGPVSVQIVAPDGEVLLERTRP